MAPNNWSYIPSGLGPGDSFRLLFATDGAVDGMTNGIRRRNTHVRNKALANEF